MVSRLTHVCLLAVIACTFVQGASASHRRVRRSIWERFACPGGNVEERKDGQYCCHTRITKECTRISTGGYSRFWPLQDESPPKPPPLCPNGVLKTSNNVVSCCVEGKCEPIYAAQNDALPPCAVDKRQTIGGEPYCCDGPNGKCRSMKQQDAASCTDSDKRIISGELYCCDGPGGKCRRMMQQDAESCPAGKGKLIGGAPYCCDGQDGKCRSMLASDTACNNKVIINKNVYCCNGPNGPCNLIGVETNSGIAICKTPRLVNNEMKCCDDKGENCKPWPTTSDEEACPVKKLIDGKPFCCDKDGFHCQPVQHDGDGKTKQEAEQVCAAPRDIRIIGGKPHCCLGKVCDIMATNTAPQKDYFPMLGPIVCPPGGVPVLGGTSRCIERGWLTYDEGKCAGQEAVIKGRKFCCRDNGNICESMDHTSPLGKIVLEKVPCPPERSEFNRIIEGQNYCCSGTACSNVPNIYQTSETRTSGILQDAANILEGHKTLTFVVDEFEKSDLTKPHEKVPREQRIANSHSNSYQPILVQSLTKQSDPTKIIVQSPSLQPREPDRFSNQPASKTQPENRIIVQPAGDSEKLIIIQAVPGQDEQIVPNSLQPIIVQSASKHDIHHKNVQQQILQEKPINAQKFLNHQFSQDKNKPHDAIYYNRGYTATNALDKKVSLAQSGNTAHGNSGLTPSNVNHVISGQLSSQGKIIEQPGSVTTFFTRHDGQNDKTGANVEQVATRLSYSNNVHQHSFTDHQRHSGLQSVPKQSTLSSQPVQPKQSTLSSQPVQPKQSTLSSQPVQPKQAEDPLLKHVKNTGSRVETGSGNRNDQSFAGQSKQSVQPGITGFLEQQKISEPSRKNDEPHRQEIDTSKTLGKRPETRPGLNGITKFLDEIKKAGNLLLLNQNRNVETSSLGRQAEATKLVDQLKLLNPGHLTGYENLKPRVQGDESKPCTSKAYTALVTCRKITGKCPGLFAVIIQRREGCGQTELASIRSIGLKANQNYGLEFGEHSGCESPQHNSSPLVTSFTVSSPPNPPNHVELLVPEMTTLHQKSITITEIKTGQEPKVYACGTATVFPPVLV